MRLVADLHIHSALSPCGSLEMSPREIVQRARSRGLDLIAVTDHNSMANAFHAAAAAGGRPRVLFGMEAQTREEVHVLCLFAERAPAERFYEEIYPLLPDVPNNPDYFGDQVEVDADDEVVRFEPRLLLNALEVSIDELQQSVENRGGIVIPAHIESPHYGLLTNLGFIPPTLADGLLEISCGTDADALYSAFPHCRGAALVTFSDAHYPADIGRACTVFEVPEFSLSALQQAGREGRLQRRSPHG